jgi:nicotinate-nucleotide adenylyltransferase
MAEHAPHDPPGPPRRIGIFGGSFDPIHEGHLHAARTARDRFQLDRVVFVPASRSPFKGGHVPAPGPDRLRMVELAIAGERGFEASDLELARGGPSFTIDTVRALPQAIGERADVEIFLVLGGDNLAQLGAWREARALLERVQPIVVHRAGEADAELAGVRRALGDALADKVRRGYVRLPPVEVSSTELRGELATDAAREHAIPPAVLAYIRERGLYGAAR